MNDSTENALLFPNRAWGHFAARWEASLGNPDVLRGMKACGINLAGLVLPEHLDAVHAAGLKAIVFDPRSYAYEFRSVSEAEARPRLESLVKDVGQHPALAGYYVKDEPHVSEFAGLALVGRLLREIDPKHWAYFNLFPDYASQEQLGVETYEEYVESYLQIVRPPFLSYDHYALFENAPLRKSYFANLEIIRAASLRHNLPFWNIVLANAHFTYAEPTSASIRFQAFTTLAYGGKGISWFTYIAPEVGNYRAAALDQFGNYTATWSYLEHVNLQIAQLAPVLVRLQSRRVYHFGEVPEKGRPAPASALVRSIRALHQQFLVGELQHLDDGSDYLIVVNKDLTHSTNYALELSEPGIKIERVSPFQGTLQPLGGEDDWLASGQGALLRLARA